MVLNYVDAGLVLTYQVSNNGFTIKFDKLLSVILKYLGTTLLTALKLIKQQSLYQSHNYESLVGQVL